MAQYRKKPLVVEAEQFWPETRPWPAGVYDKIVAAARFVRGEECVAYFVDTLEGRFEVTPGDWIITGIKGERYPCKPDIFAATYEAVGPPQTKDPCECHERDGSYVCASCYSGGYRGHMQEEED